MKVTVTHKNNAEVELAGTLAVASIEKEFPKALEHIIAQVELPGFRKGKVPEARVLQEVGHLSIWREAAETVLREQLADILKEHKVMPIVAPSIMLKVSEHNAPVDFTVTVVTPPTIEVGEYRAAAAAALKALTPLDTAKEKVQALKELSGQVFNMLGHAPRGEASRLDELSDEEAKRIGFENVAALTFFIDAEADRAVENFDNQRRRGAVADAIIKTVQVTIPAVMQDDESRAMLDTMKADIVRQGATWPQYLKVRNMTEEQVVAELKPMAVKRVTLDMFFAKVAQEEKVTPDDAEVHRVAHALEQQGTPTDRAHSFAAETSIREKIWVLLGVATAKPQEATPAVGHAQ